MNKTTKRNANRLMTDEYVIERIFQHIDNKTTDMGSNTWREPTEHYLSESHFAKESQLLSKQTLLMCPSAAIAEYGAYTARDVQGVPLFIVRNKDGRAQAFRNACRHRGVKIVTGSGRKSAFVCPFHAWTYDTDGALKVIPHEYGFPQINKCEKGLVPVKTIEAQGLIFVCLSEDCETHVLNDLPELVPEDYRLYEQTDAVIPANWKTVVESFLEGYHIKATHPKSFFPVQYDNLNVIEHFGDNSRICFPYRAIEKLRSQAPNEWYAESKLTYVYHLFPNVIVTTHPGFRVVISIEPLSANKTIQTTYVVTNVDKSDKAKLAQLREAIALAYSSIDEDRAMILGAQAGLASGANAYLEFGLFESAIVHFHNALSGKV